MFLQDLFVGSGQSYPAKGTSGVLFCLGDDLALTANPSWLNRWDSSTSPAQSDATKQPSGEDLAINTVTRRAAVFDGVDDYLFSALGIQLSIMDCTITVVAMVTNTTGEIYRQLVYLGPDGISAPGQIGSRGVPTLGHLTPEPEVGTVNIWAAPDSVSIDESANEGVAAVYGYSRRGGTNGNGGEITIKFNEDSVTGMQTWDSDSSNGLRIAGCGPPYPLAGHIWAIIIRTGTDAGELAADLAWIKSHYGF